MCAPICFAERTNFTASQVKTCQINLKRLVNRFHLHRSILVCGYTMWSLTFYCGHLWVEVSLQLFTWHKNVIERHPSIITLGILNFLLHPENSVEDKMTSNQRANRSKYGGREVKYCKIFDKLSKKSYEGILFWIKRRCGI